MTAIRLVLFDALHTVITPRLPIHIQYAQVFESHLGQLDPLRVREGFKRALKQLQKDKPAYIGGANDWWAEVIRRTALDAGADAHRLESSLSIIVPQLMQRFSGRDGYRTFDDTIPALQTLKDNGVQTGMISNADSRMRDIIVDLGLSQFLHPILFSEEEGVEKPNPVIWQRALSRAGVTASQAVHIGDELETDYWGAIRAGTHAFLLRRPGPDGEGEYRERHEDLRNIRTVDNISEMVQWVINTNSNE